ncbi:MAG: cell division protein FtsZ, partial [Candidatus Pacearchaeota archaeon]
LPLHTAFKIADEILTNAVKGITELVTKAGLVNLDLADVKAVMLDGGVAMIGVGESDSANRAEEAIEKAIENPLLDVDITNATGALINITGGLDMKLEEAKKIIEEVSKRISPDAKLIWGAQLSEDMGKTLRVLLIVTGVESPQIMGKGKLKERELEALEEDFGIDFFEAE